MNWTFFDAGGAVIDLASNGSRQEERGWNEATGDPVPVPSGTVEVELSLATNRAVRGSTWIDDVQILWS